MQKQKKLPMLAGVMAMLIFPPLLVAQTVLDYPSTPKGSVVDTYFGIQVADPYRWLEKDSSPAVQQWDQIQNRLTQNYLSGIPGREKLTARFKALLYTNEINTPIEAGHELFYERRSPDQEKAILYDRDTHGDEHRLLDPNTWSPHVSLGEWYPSPDGKTVVYLVKENNADEAVLHLLNVSTGMEASRETISGANFADPAWDSESRGFYYMRLPSTSTVAEADRVANADVRFHRLGTDPAVDPLVYPKTNSSQLYLSPSVSSDGRWLLISIIDGWNSNSIYVKDLHDSKASFKPLFISTTALATATEWKGSFYIETNDEAPHYRLLQVPVQQTDRRFWKTLVPERSDVTISDMKVVGNSLILVTLKNAVNQIEFRSLKGSLLQTLSLPGLGQVSDLSGRENGSTIYYQFESFTVPSEIFKLSIPSGKSELWAKMDVPADPSPYQVSQVWFPSKDGTPISMFVVHRASVPLNTSTPFLLNGYGGFDEPMLPRFNAVLYPWLEAGGAYALVNLRGGGEYGEAWHQAGMLTHKQNTFDDFAAAAQFLIAKGYTSHGRVVTEGASNGGLLVAAMITQHPELFRAVVCKVPLTDMIRYSLVGEGQAWIPEYGSITQEDQFRALLAYSPYHHVTRGTAYPSILFIAAENDDRVGPMHARKMVAALQSATSSKNPILLWTQEHAGHGGADFMKTRVDEYTDRLLFLLHELDVNP